MKNIGIILCITSMCFLFGCSKDDDLKKSITAVSDVQKSPREMTFNVSTYTDPDTGCQYLVSWNSSMTPRIDMGGKPLCVKKK